MSHHKFELFIALALAVLLLGACVSPEAPASTDIAKVITPLTTLETEEIPTQISAPVEAAVQELARQLGVDPASIQVVSFNEAEWPDSCLGAAQPEEMCLDVITPGYGGFLEVNGVQYEFRSDKSGDQVRIIPGVTSAARQALAGKLGVGSDRVQVISYEQVMWRDSCLGVDMPNQACMDVITPGYEIVLQADGEQYVYHTDQSGNNLVLAEVPQPQISDALVTWSQSGELGCQQALINLDGISFGPCEGPLVTVPFPADTESNDLKYFSDKYAPFEAQTAAGNIRFNGMGSEVATPAEQRMIAEWAKLTMQVAESGRAGAAWGLALAWHREGGMAKFCDDLGVHVTGIALASTCHIQQPAPLNRIFLNATQLEQLYAWLDTLSTFEVKQTDPGTDAVTVYMQFVGNGDQEPSAEVQQAILNFADQIFAQAISGGGTQ